LFLEREASEREGFSSRLSSLSIDNGHDTTPAETLPVPLSLRRATLLARTAVSWPPAKHNGARARRKRLLAAARMRARARVRERAIYSQQRGSNGTSDARRGGPKVA